jgi:hypothetical protein
MITYGGHGPLFGQYETDNILLVLASFVQLAGGLAWCQATGGELCSAMKKMKFNRSLSYLFLPELIVFIFSACAIYFALPFITWTHTYRWGVATI